MVSPISVSVEARPPARIPASPLTVIMVVPKVDTVPTVDLTIGAPAGELTEITAANVTTQLSAIPSASAATQTGVARAAYDLIEATAAVRVFVLPFAASGGAATAGAARAAAIAGAIKAALDDPVQRGKLPETTGVDIIVVPREVGLTTQAPAIVGQLKTSCAALECIAIVDAGDSGAAADARPASDKPDAASVKTWSATNGGIAIYGVSNRGDVADYNGMWGSVIMTAHHARWASSEGVGTSPYDLVHELAGVGTITPGRILDLQDGSSEAVAMDRDDEVSSLVTHAGVHYIWGGRSNAGGASDPREIIANHAVVNRSVKIARGIASRVVRRRATANRLQSLRVDIERAVAGAYVPDALRSIEAATPVLTGNSLRVPFDLRFWTHIDSVSLVAEVYI